MEKLLFVVVTRNIDEPSNTHEDRDVPGTKKKDLEGDWSELPTVTITLRATNSTTTVKNPGNHQVVIRNWELWLQPKSGSLCGTLGN